MNKSYLTLEFKLFFRNTASWIGILVLLLTGFTGLYFGKKIIEKQHDVIKTASVLQRVNTSNNIAHFGKDAGLFFYHNKFSLANKPTVWAGIANGQRDVNPYLISVTMLGLEGQLYDTDIANPVSLLFGNIDLNFVFLFVFPLVIIAFTYNLLSEQKESGLWPVLRAQTNQLFKLVWLKFLVRLLTVYAVAVILLIISFYYMELPFDDKFIYFCALIVLYLAFWFAMAFLLIALGKSSSFNASAFVALWVLICIVIPASLNLYVTQRYPMPEALAHVIKQREGYHEKWDMDKQVTMKPFFKHYPVLAKYPFPEEKSFSWFWYYGMQQMGDDQAMDSRLAMEQKLASRQGFTNLIALFFPTIQLQLGVNELAGTDLANHLKFQQAVRNYHEQLRLHFYPAIFLNQEVIKTDIKKTKLRMFNPQTNIIPYGRLVSLFVMTLILSLISVLKFKSGRYRLNP
ncbi:DUF3526 domain-containing protein [Pedobacter aquatilis]|uniref:DUF3526 domain-containing protein n=1 Tax=Pedobacter aquatilis TaxID=351343 RepID=UPI00292D451D|nr:DUF3526 domain-containing protein [Pedobacter aquatilis]